jgi:transcriptional regulator with XRE-family HTH domain
MSSDNGTRRGGLIRETRRALHLSQEALARRANCSTVYIRLIESGYAPGHSDVLPRILAALDDAERDQIVPETNEAPAGNGSLVKNADAGGGRGES